MPQLFKVQYLIIWDDGCAVDWETLAECPSLVNANNVFGSVLVNDHLWIECSGETKSFNIVSTYMEDLPENAVVLRIITETGELIRTSSTKNYSVNSQHSLYKGLMTCH